MFEVRQRLIELRQVGHAITTVTHFKQLEKEIYGVYTNCSLIETGYIRSTTKFLDEFYKTINDPRSVKAAFSYPCNKDGTGNVVIKGLDKN